ncbi:hypothetical protein CYCD_28040 [Tenuifilaceae bacterium CYCD]|nr:hypothetical protein CYCD_28040 [Tenuifilaceae bacterium CYCD]
MKKYYWSGVSNDERTKAISEINSIVNSYATILNFQRFSDISLNLILEAEEGKLNDLLMGLKRIMTIQVDTENTTGSQVECLVLLNITFTKGTGDLEIEVPNIPE